MARKKKTPTDTEARKRCKRCKLAVKLTPYGRWKHCGNKQTGAGCGKEPEVE